MASKKYTTLIVVDNNELCETLNGTSSNSILKYFISYLGKSISDHLHPCPYKVGNFPNIFGNKNYRKCFYFKGELKLYGLTLGESGATSMLPNGIYKGCVKMHDDLDDNIFKLCAISESLKTVKAKV